MSFLQATIVQTYCFGIKKKEMLIIMMLINWIFFQPGGSRERNKIATARKRQRTRSEGRRNKIPTGKDSASKSECYSPISTRCCFNCCGAFQADMAKNKTPVQSSARKKKLFQGNVGNALFTPPQDADCEVNVTPRTTVKRQLRSRTKKNNHKTPK